MPKASGIFPDSTRMRALPFWFAVLAPCLGLSTGSCRQSRSEVGRPEARLSASVEAQANFRNLRAAWFSGSTSERRRLEPDLRRFLVRFPNEEPSDMVRVLLAFDCVSRGSLQGARVRRRSARLFARRRGLRAAARKQTRRGPERARAAGRQDRRQRRALVVQRVARARRSVGAPLQQRSASRARAADRGLQRWPRRARRA